MIEEEIIHVNQQKEELILQCVKGVKEGRKEGMKKGGGREEGGKRREEGTKKEREEDEAN